MTYSPEHVLSRYPPFAFALTARRRYSVTWSGKANVALTFGFAVAFLLASFHENTLIMPGRAVGLLEHPGIWLFLAAQALIPWVVTRSLRTFRRLSSNSSVPLKPEFLRDHFQDVECGLIRSLERESFRSKALFDLLLTIGFTAWVWNTFQNQEPMRFLHFDFWDSSNHLVGYWLTRFYKLYIWVLIGPAIVHAEICLVRAVKNLFSTVVREHAIILDPYHPDSDGGLDVLVDAVINPMVPTVVVSSFLTVAAFWVHGKYDVTTVGGLAMTIALLLFVYFVPATSLRRAILDEKQRQQDCICRMQRTLYSQLLSSATDHEILKEHTSTLASLADLGKRINGISPWPQLARIGRLAGVAAASPLIGWTLKQLQVLLPAVLHS